MLAKTAGGMQIIGQTLRRHPEEAVAAMTEVTAVVPDLVLLAVVLVLARLLTRVVRELTGSHTITVREKSASIVEVTQLISMIVVHVAMSRGKRDGFLLLKHSVTGYSSKLEIRFFNLSF